jgi:hypothetical protein
MRYTSLRAAVHAALACAAFASFAAACATDPSTARSLARSGDGGVHAPSLSERGAPLRIDGERAVVRRDLWLPCEAVRCAAWWYLPEPPSAVRSVPAVVMAHGFGMTREVFLPDVALAFARAGFAVLLFDYRYFGDSEGEPRERLHVASQLADWRSALLAARAESAIDPDRIALFGTSLSGGHVLAIAAGDRGVRAVIAQVPFVDGDAGDRTPLGYRVRAALAIALDYTRTALGFAPHYIPVIGSPETFAAQSADVSYRAFERIAPPPSAWRNRVAARALLEVSPYHPGRRAAEIEAALLLVAARDDELIPLASVAEVAERAPRAELVVVDGTHFEIYGPPLREVVTALEIEFLQESLREPWR